MVVKAGAKALKFGFGKLNGKLKGMMQSKESKFNEEAVKHSNLIFNELSKFVMHFCNMYQMDKSKMHILLTELQSN